MDADTCSVCGTRDWRWMVAYWQPPRPLYVQSPLTRCDLLCRDCRAWALTHLQGKAGPAMVFQDYVRHLDSLTEL